MADSKNKAAKLVGITVPKETNCGQWYVEVVQKAELVEYYSEVSWPCTRCPFACCWNPADCRINYRADFRFLHPATYVNNAIDLQRQPQAPLPPSSSLH